MAKKNRKCICCGEVYSYCPNCGGNNAEKQSWYSQFCSEDCKELWATATKYNVNMLTKQEAKEIISALTLKPHSEYVECVQRDLKVILAEEPKAVIQEVAAEEPVAELTPVTEEKSQKYTAKKKSHEVVKQEENK